MVYDFLEGLIIGALGFSLLFIILMWVLVKRLAARLFNTWLQERLRKEVAKSLAIQRPVIKGKISEQLFPILYNKLGDLADFRFLGSPVDYIIFEGLSEARDGVDKEVKIKFIELKTGHSSLNRAEQMVKDAVETGRVSWEEVDL